jgi:hypothetical protein
MSSDKQSASNTSRASTALYTTVRSALEGVLGRDTGLYGQTTNGQRWTDSGVLHHRAEILLEIGQVIENVKEEDGNFATYAERLKWVLSNLLSPSVVLDRYVFLLSLYFPEHLNSPYHWQ